MAQKKNVTELSAPFNVEKADKTPLSTTAKDSTKDTISSPSLFQNHILPVKNNQPQIHYTDYDYLVTSVLFLSYVLYVWLYVSNAKRLNQVIKGFYINRYANQLAREEYSLSNRTSVFLSVLFVLTLTLFLSQTTRYYGILNQINDNLLFLLIAIGILLLYGIKLISIKLFGNIFQTTKEAGDYIITLFLFANTLGLFMLPVVICLALVEQVSALVFIYTGFTIITMFLVTRIVRGVIIGLNSARVSIFYLFLYLCTLEILPFVIMVKLFLIKIK